MTHGMVVQYDNYAFWDDLTSSSWSEKASGSTLVAGLRRRMKDVKMLKFFTLHALLDSGDYPRIRSRTLSNLRIFPTEKKNFDDFESIWVCVIYCMFSRLFISIPRHVWFPGKFGNWNGTKIKRKTISKGGWSSLYWRKPQFQVWIIIIIIEGILIITHV